MYLAKPTTTTTGPKKYLALCSENLPKLLLWQFKEDIVLTTHKGYLLSPSTFYHACLVFFFCWYFLFGLGFVWWGLGCFGFF